VRAIRALWRANPITRARMRVCVSRSASPGARAAIFGAEEPSMCAVPGTETTLFVGGVSLVMIGR